MTAHDMDAVVRVVTDIVTMRVDDIRQASTGLSVEDAILGNDQLIEKFEEAEGGGGAGMPWSQIRFGWAGVFYDEAANANVFRVYKGAIQINNDTYTLPVDPVGSGADPVNYATDEIGLTTDYIVVYAGCTVVAGEDGGAFIDAHPTDLPDMWTGSTIRIPLYTLEKYTVDPPEGAAEGYLTTRWRLYRIHNLGDITFSGLVVPPPLVQPAVLVWQDGSMQWVSAVDNFSVLQKQDDELVFDWTRQP